MAEIEHSTDKCLSPKVVQPRRTGAQIALEIRPSELCAIFGVADPDVATRLLSQLLDVLRPDTSQPVDPALIKQALGFISGIGPKDTTEAMTTTLMAGAHYRSLDLSGAFSIDLVSNQ